MFDSSEADLDWGAPLDAPDTLVGANVYDNGTPFSGVISFSVARLADEGSGADLLLAAHDCAGDGIPGTVAVLHDDGQFISLVWSYSSHDAPLARVVGTPGRQRVNITAAWPDLWGGECCALRGFDATVTRVDGGGAPFPDYEVVSDDRPWLGAWVETVGDLLPSPSGTATTPIGDLARLDPNDLVVLSVDPGSPAARALRPGDVVTAIGGPQPLRADVEDSLPTPLYGEFGQLRAGDRAVLTILRQGLRRMVAVTVGSRDDEAAGSDPPEAVDLGMEVDAAPGSVLVEAVQRNSPAAQAGVVPGDHVTSVDGLAVTSPAALVWAELEGSFYDPAPLRLVDPGGLSRTVQISGETSNDLATDIIDL